MPAPAVIEVRNVSKRFRIRELHSEGAGGLLRRLGGRRGTHYLEVLNDVSFDVEKGEFFGICGLNGSGKSTLLKLICSTYRADAGTIRIAGRLAPFLELGVGFNPELAAEENVLMNGVMMGLTPREARARTDEVIEFAGLSEYTDLRLKNYSSGMRVRLAFAVMTRAQADVMLIDEVLAVGDAAFQERCSDEFQRMHSEGRTIVLVTHSMDAIGLLCDRAMLLHDGGVNEIGQPESVANRYLEVNAQTLGASFGQRATVTDLADPGARLTELTTPAEKVGGRHVIGVHEPVQLEAILAIDRELERPGLSVQINNGAGAVLHQQNEWLPAEAADGPLAGRSLRVSVTIENPLGPGRYMIGCSAVSRDAEGEWKVESRGRFVPLEVVGEPRIGSLALQQHGQVVLEPENGRPETMRP